RSIMSGLRSSASALPCLSLTRWWLFGGILGRAGCTGCSSRHCQRQKLKNQNHKPNQIKTQREEMIDEEQTKPKTQTNRGDSPPGGGRNSIRLRAGQKAQHCHYLGRRHRPV